MFSRLHIGALSPLLLAMLQGIYIKLYEKDYFKLNHIF